MSVGIMLLPAEGTVLDEINDAHCTLVYAGKLADVPSVQLAMMAQRCQFLASTTPPFDALVVGTDVFGKGEDETNVVRVESTFLHVMRNWVVMWHASKHDGFKPHVSYKQLAEIPQTVSFDRVALWINEDKADGQTDDDVAKRRLTWWLGTGQRVQQ